MGNVQEKMSQRLITDAELLGGMSFKAPVASGDVTVGTMDKYPFTWYRKALQNPLWPWMSVKGLCPWQRAISQSSVFRIK